MLVTMHRMEVSWRFFDWMVVSLSCRVKSAFHSTKIRNFSAKRGQMVRKFPWKVSGKSKNCWISEMRTIQPKIPEVPGGKSNGTEILGSIYHPLFGKGARAPPPNGWNADRTRESGGNRTYGNSRWEILENLGIPSREVVLFLRKMLFHLLLEISENSNRNFFWMEGAQDFNQKVKRRWTLHETRVGTQTLKKGSKTSKKFLKGVQGKNCVWHTGLRAWKKPQAFHEGWKIRFFSNENWSYSDS